METRVLMELAIVGAVEVDLADLVDKEAMASEEEEEAVEGDGGEIETGTTQTIEEEGLSREAVAVVAGEEEEEVVNALTMGTVKREGEEGEEEEGSTVTALNQEEEEEEIEKVRERERERERQSV